MTKNLSWELRIKYAMKSAKENCKRTFLFHFHFHATFPHWFTQPLAVWFGTFFQAILTATRTLPLTASSLPSPTSSPWVRTTTWSGCSSTCPCTPATSSRTTTPSGGTSTTPSTLGTCPTTSSSSSGSTIGTCSPVTRRWTKSKCRNKNEEV